MVDPQDTKHPSYPLQESKGCQVVLLKKVISLFEFLLRHTNVRKILYFHNNNTHFHFCYCFVYEQENHSKSSKFRRCCWFSNLKKYFWIFQLGWKNVVNTRVTQVVLQFFFYCCIFTILYKIYSIFVIRYFCR